MELFGMRTAALVLDFFHIGMAAQELFDIGTAARVVDFLNLRTAARVMDFFHLGTAAYVLDFLNLRANALVTNFFNLGADALLLDDVVYLLNVVNYRLNVVHYRLNVNNRLNVNYGLGHADVLYGHNFVNLRLESLLRHNNFDTLHRLFSFNRSGFNHRWRSLFGRRGNGLCWLDNNRRRLNDDDGDRLWNCVGLSSFR